jgi:hypothetical protein
MPNPPAPGEKPSFRTITYPLPDSHSAPSEMPDVPHATHPPPTDDAENSGSLPGYRAANPPGTGASSRNPLPRQTTTPPRTFAILHTKPGESPYDLGPWENVRSVMGNSLLDWMLPLRYSPCCDHSSGLSAYQLGPLVDRMRREAGIMPPSGSSRGKRRRRRRSRKNVGEVGGGTEMGAVRPEARSAEPRRQEAEADMHGYTEDEGDDVAGREVGDRYE